MNIKYLGAVAKRYPALARALELGIISLVIYVIGVGITGDPLDKQAIIAALGTPLLAFLSKTKRDIEK